MERLYRSGNIIGGPAARVPLEFNRFWTPHLPLSAPPLFCQSYLRDHSTKCSGFILKILAEDGAFFTIEQALCTEVRCALLINCGGFSVCGRPNKNYKVRAPPPVIEFLNKQLQYCRYKICMFWRASKAGDLYKSTL